MPEHRTSFEKLKMGVQYPKVPKVSSIFPRLQEQPSKYRYYHQGKKVQCIELFCPDGNTYISTVAPEVEEILTKLWGLLDIAPPFSISQMKFYALALFSLMQNLNDIPPSQACTFFTETQVDIAKRVEKIITSDLRQHHPAWELAAQFSVSETSLKNYFRGVFGQNISFYLRECRMKRAAELLVSTTRSVAEIAEQVGYMNQSKFALVFKKRFSMSPLEYRRYRNLNS